MTDAPTPPTPYVGLVPYAEDDADLFFGRDEEKRIVTGNLRASRLTIVYGSSGVGKTSLLRAGVVHDLRAQMLETAKAQPERAPFAVCVFADWRDDPLADLMAALRAAGAEALGGRELERWQRGDPIVPALRRWTARVRTILVVLDQFEDYFLYHPDEAGSDEFAAQLAAVVNEPNLRVNVLLAIRDDAWAKLDRFEGHIPHLFTNYIRVEHLNRAAARQAIEQPIAAWNRRLPSHEQPYRLESALVEAVIDAAETGGLAPASTQPFPETERPKGEEIEAPFLQLVMQRLWRATLEAGSHDLSRATLERLGGAQQIVENHLLDALAALTASEQAVAANLFRFLVTRSKTKISHSVADLAEWTRQPEPEVTAVLEKLCRGESGRILRRVPPATDGDSMRYELFHDVLAEPIVEWRRGYDQERARRAAVRRLLRVGGVLMSLVAIFAALGVWALVQRSDAKHAARSAASFALASESRAQLRGHVERSLLLALEAYRTSPTGEATSAVVDALESPNLADVEAILRGGSDGVRAVAFSRDGGTLASADFDGTLRLWDVRARKPLGIPLREDIGEVWSVAFAPGGGVLAAAGADGTVRLWNVRTGRPLGATRRVTGAVLSVAFSPDGRLLASSGDDGTVWLRDSRTLAQSGRPLRAHAGRIVTVAFSPDGRTLAAAGFDQVVRLWDVRSRKLLRRVRYGGHGPVLSVAFSANGRLLAASNQDGTVRLVNTRSFRYAGAPLDAQAGAVWGVAFSSDGRTLAASGFDGTIRLWDTQTRSSLGELRGHARALTGVVFAPDGLTLASASYDGTVRLWSFPRREHQPQVLRPPAERVATLAFSPDGHVFASGGYHPTLRLWNLETAAPLRRVADDAAGPVESIAFSPDGDALATGGDDGVVRLWQAPSLEPLGRPFEAGTGAVHSVGFSPDGKLLAAAGDDGRVRIWDIHDRRPVGSPQSGHRGAVWSVAFSPDGGTVASAGFDGTVRLWSARGQGSAGRLPLGAEDLPLSVAFSPDGRTLAIGEVSGWVRLWDVRRHRWAGEPLKGPAQRIDSIAFTPNGATLVSAGDDGMVRLWDVRARRLLGRPLDAGVGTVFGVAISPDGRTIASAHQDGAVRLWRGILWSDGAALRAMVCRRVVGNLTRSEWAELVPGLAYRSSCAPR